MSDATRSDRDIVNISRLEANFFGYDFPKYDINLNFLWNAWSLRPVLDINLKFLEPNLCFSKLNDWA